MGDIAANFVVSIVELVKDRCRNYLAVRIMSKAVAVPVERERAVLYASPREKRELARDAWRSIVEAVLARREYMQGQATRCGLTLPQAHMLRVLGTGAQTTSSLARVFAC